MRGAGRRRAGWRQPRHHHRRRRRISRVWRTRLVREDRAVARRRGVASVIRARRPRPHRTRLLAARERTEDDRCRRRRGRASARSDDRCRSRRRRSTSRMTTARPRVVAALPELFPSTVLNVAKPLLRLVEAGAIDLELALHVTVRARQIQQADVLVLSHTINPAHAWMLDCAQAAGTPLIYDIDENLLEPPDDIPGLEFHRDPARQATVRRALTQAVLVRTYAPALQRYLCRFNEHVVRTDGPVDWRLVPEAVQRDHQRVRVVYATSRTTEDTIGAMVVEPLRRLLDTEPTVDLTLWGPQFGDLAGHPRVRFRPFVRGYDRYFQEFARAGFDIGVAPMPNEVFYQSKTATKFREY